MNGYLLDTNVYNHILDEEISIEEFAGAVPLYVTHIQPDELRNTSVEARRIQLEEVFRAIPQESIPTASFALDVSRLGQASLSDGKLYEGIRTRPAYRKFLGYDHVGT